MSQQRRKARKDRKKNEVRTKRLEKRREDSDVEKRLRKRMRSDPARSTIRLNENVPMPPRNGPCPQHPEYKLKKCPHGCMALFARSRMREAGDVIVAHVEEDSPKQGKFGVETDAVGGLMSDLSQVMGDF